MVEFYKPLRLSAKRLDRYLAGGWFRSSNGLFRNQILCLDGQLCTVVNIRLPLRNLRFGKSQRKILNRSRRCTIEIAPLRIDEELDALYQLTKSRFKGFVFPNLSSFLYDFFDRAIFKSFTVRVYHEGKLIAASVFDCGEKSIMSVLGIYDPEYSDWSPGKLTMLLEIQWAMQNGFHHYYPGYVLHESRSFDYKTSLGKYQFLGAKNRWTYDYQKAIQASPVAEINAKSKILEEALHELNIPCKRLLYKLFSLGYAYEEGSFVRYPIIFVLPELSENPFKICLAAYHLESDSYHISQPIPVHDEFLAAHQSLEFQNADVYYDLVLQDNLEDRFEYASAKQLAQNFHALWSKRGNRSGLKSMALGKFTS
ncbi:MAG: arginyl-tRNA--protein transferase 1 [Bacteroidota bacterium]|nr:arginyl-tRNA--protein transferase 1 [Bacteroidota bacterium]